MNVQSQSHYHFTSKTFNQTRDKGIQQQQEFKFLSCWCWEVTQIPKYKNFLSLHMIAIRFLIE